MTGLDGDRHAGWWWVTAVDAPHRFSFEDGFADADFNPLEGMPVSAPPAGRQRRPRPNLMAS
jgi:hypothetical protein